MTHARFLTPNLWSVYLGQVAVGSIDSNLFPEGNHIAALLRKFKTRPDLARVNLPPAGAGYLASLPREEYRGSEKVATLLCINPVSGANCEVPDWTIYGSSLEGLTIASRATLQARGVDITTYYSLASRGWLPGRGSLARA